MLELNSIQSTPAVYGTARVSTVEIASYDVEARDNDGFVGDRASSVRSALRAVAKIPSAMHQ